MMAPSNLPLPERIRVVEVGLRDGLQAVTAPLPTDAKVDLVHALVEAGMREIEAVSFAHPGVLPQLADADAVMARVPRDADAVMARVPRVEGLRYRGLVPNARGARRAADCGLDEMVAVVSADNEVSVRNQRRTVTEMLAELEEIATLASAAKAQLIVAVACAFFAPTRGPVPVEETDRVVDAAVDAGAAAVYLAATSGMEGPHEIADGVLRVRRRHPHLAVGVHLHNRNGLAMANALAAMTVGADWIEAAFAGLGGDLWFPGDPQVLGNAAMEDLLHMCETIGVTTGVDLPAYLQIVGEVERLTGRPSTSFVSRGGTRAGLAAAHWPDDVAEAAHGH